MERPSRRHTNVTHHLEKDDLYNWKSLNRVFLDNRFEKRLSRNAASAIYKWMVDHGEFDQQKEDGSFLYKGKTIREKYGCNLDYLLAYFELGQTEKEKLRGSRQIELNPHIHKMARKKNLPDEYQPQSTQAQTAAGKLTAVKEMIKKFSAKMGSVKVMLLSAMVALLTSMVINYPGVNLFQALEKEGPSVPISALSAKPNLKPMETYHLAWFYIRDHNWEAANEYIETLKAAGILKSQQYHYLAGYWFIEKGYPQKARFHLNQLKAGYNKQTPLKKFEYHSFASDFYAAIGDFKATKQELEQALAVMSLVQSNRVNYNVMKSATLEKIGTCAILNQNYELAFSNIEKAFDLAAKGDLNSYKATSLSKLALLHALEGRRERANKLLERAVGLALDLNDPTVSQEVKTCMQLVTGFSDSQPNHQAVSTDIYYWRANILRKAFNASFNIKH